MNPLIAGLLAVITAGVATADQVRVVRHGDERLVGIDAVDVVMTLAGDTNRCGLERMRLQLAAVETLRGTGLKVTISERASSWSYSVLVSAHTALLTNACATAISTELIAQVDGIPEADRLKSAGTWGSFLVGQLSLIRDIAMVTSDAAAHAVPLRNVLHEQLRTIGERISAANR